MKIPNAGNSLPDFAGQSKILFCNEGNPIAMLLTNRAGRRQTAQRRFASAEAALSWCRRSSAVLVYFPVALERN